jgi:hypothetical protein
MFFRTSTVFARVTKVMPWILSKIQTGECGYIDELCKQNPYNSECNLYRNENNDYEQYQGFLTSRTRKNPKEYRGSRIFLIADEIDDMIEKLGV